MYLAINLKLVTYQSKIYILYLAIYVDRYIILAILYRNSERVKEHLYIAFLSHSSKNNVKFELFYLGLESFVSFIACEPQRQAAVSDKAIVPSRSFSDSVKKAKGKI